MLASLASVLRIAEANNKAIGAFDVTSLEGLRGAVEAAEMLNTPIILQFANGIHGNIIPLEMIGSMMVQAAERAAVPICVMLDHGTDYREIKTSLDLGFTGIMYDGSALPYEKNAANTSYAVELASPYGASVEGELGSMNGEAGSNANAEKDYLEKAIYTDPEAAARFVKDTGIDALACSFGTSHGVYAKAPKLEFDLIADIHKAAGLPIVMHGGSGLSDDTYRKCISNGVRKINFYTYSVKYAGKAVSDKIRSVQDEIYYNDIIAWGKDSFKDTFSHAIEVFNNE